MTDKEKLQLVETALKQSASDAIACETANFWINELTKLETELFLFENSDERFSPGANEKVEQIIKQLEIVARKMDIELENFKKINDAWDILEKKLKI